MGILCALIMNPRLLLLLQHQPFGALDPTKRCNLLPQLVRAKVTTAGVQSSSVPCCSMGPFGSLEPMGWLW